MLNGVPYEKTWIRHEDLINGAVLEFEMGPEPSDWGTGIDALPPSIMPAELDGAGPPQPLGDLTDGLIATGRGTATDSAGGDTQLLFDNTTRAGP